ncbi:MAG TPA: hypothetical protein VMN78_04210 [Longimicrobiales bacterium]|nr:hypothetical protein [Longimicrobiales bacterium]
MSEHFRAEQIAGRVAADLRRGRGEGEIIAELVAMGATDEQAEAVVTRIAAEVRPKQKQSLGSQALGVVLLLAAFALLNGALWVGQGYFQKDDVARAEAFATRLDAMGQEIAGFEAQLEEYQRRSDRIDSIGAVLAASPRMSRVSQRDYEVMIERWNADLPVINRTAAGYDSLITVYNKQVDEYNALAEKAYSRWLLLPGGGSSARRYGD